MPAERLPMRKVREVLRLKHACGASDRLIAQSLGIGRTTVGRVSAACRGGRASPGRSRARRCRAGAASVHAGGVLRRRRRGRSRIGAGCPCRAAPARRDADAAVGGIPGRASRRLWLQPVLRPLWRVAPGRHGDDAADPCRRREAVRRLRRRHGAGDRRGSPGRCAQLTSSSRFWGPRTTPLPRRAGARGWPDWIGAHVDALAFLGGVPKLIVCDNLKAGVTAACRYEPGINRTYQDMAAHYGTSILPTRVRRRATRPRSRTAC